MSNPSQSLTRSSGEHVGDAAASEPRPARQKSTERVYEALRKKVIDSELAPGTQMLEHELAVMLGVSRTPLREALIRLQNEGLVEIVPRHGVRVVPMSAADMKEIYQVLVSLEGTAAKIIAARDVPIEMLDELEAICANMSEFLKADRMESWSLEDERFHLKLVELSGNRRLSDIVANCWDQVHRARLFTLRLRPHPQPALSIKEHYDIVTAIRHKDAELAAALARSHRERGGAHQLETIETYRFTTF